MADQDPIIRLNVAPVGGLALTAVFLLSLGGNASGQAYPRTPLLSRVDELFAEWDTEDAPGVEVGIFKDGRIIYARGFGVANLDYGIPMTPQSVLRIGSISKQFVAMCIAILAERGRLSFDDDIRTYLPEMRDYGEPITIRHLLHHTSGIREYLTLVDLIGKPEGSVFGYTTRELVELLARQQALAFDPGDQFSYTNSGYFLLAEIVTRVSGMKASAFARENIFDPLGMSHTRFYDDPNAIIPNQALGYSPTPDGGYRLDILRSEVIGDLGVITTVEDLLHWDNNFYENKLGSGSNDLIATMFTRGRTNAGEELSYALGLEFGSYRGLNTMGHGGSAVGYVAEFLQFPEQRFSVVVLSNLSSFRSGRLARQVADLYLAGQFTEPRAFGGQARRRPTAPEPITLSMAELEAFVGDFYSEELDFSYSFDVRGGSLHLELRGGRIELRPYLDDRFGWGRRELIFVRDESGLVSGLTLDAGNVRGLRFRKVAGARQSPGGASSWTAS
ncbi:MAG: serine hydrolase domain-containing protein [Actinomycetota bacterium]|nr:serine hydrolase domain-containing protein [Actinomycetota bacterium]